MMVHLAPSLPHHRSFSFSFFLYIENRDIAFFLLFLDFSGFGIISDAILTFVILLFYEKVKD